MDLIHLSISILQIKSLCTVFFIYSEGIRGRDAGVLSIGYMDAILYVYENCRSF